MVAISKSNESKLSHSRLKEVLDYNYISGQFTWKISTAARVKVGSVAGNFDKSSGYHRIQIDGTRYLAHRLAWFYCFEEWPTCMLDHENQEKLDNSIDNLREADNSKNNQNRKLLVTNSSGHRGIYFLPSLNKYKACYTKEGKFNYLGLFIKLEDAIEAYKVATKKDFGEFYYESNV